MIDLNLLTLSLVFTILLLCISCGNKVNIDSNPIPTTDIKTSEVFEQPEEAAILSVCENEENPPSCSNQKFIAHIYKNIKINTSKDHSESTLIISFIIEKDGSLSSIEILRGKATIEQSNLTQLLSKSPKWKPAKEGGKAVRSKLTLPLRIHYE